MLAFFQGWGDWFLSTRGWSKKNTPGGAPPEYSVEFSLVAASPAFAASRSMKPELPMALPMACMAKADQVRRVERKFFHPHGRRAGRLDRHDVVYLSGHTDQAAFRTVTA